MTTMEKNPAHPIAQHSCERDGSAAGSRLQAPTLGSYSGLPPPCSCPQVPTPRFPSLGSHPNFSAVPVPGDGSRLGVYFNASLSYLSLSPGSHLSFPGPPPCALFPSVPFCPPCPVPLPVPTHPRSRSGSRTDAPSRRRTRAETLRNAPQPPPSPSPPATSSGCWSRAGSSPSRPPPASSLPPPTPSAVPRATDLAWPPQEPHPPGLAVGAAPQDREPSACKFLLSPLPPPPPLRPGCQPPHCVLGGRSWAACTTFRALTDWALQLLSLTRGWKRKTILYPARSQALKPKRVSTGPSHPTSTIPCAHHTPYAWHREVHLSSGRWEMGFIAQPGCVCECVHTGGGLHALSPPTQTHRDGHG